MILSRRERTLAAMLERWHELATPDHTTAGDRRDSRTLEHDHATTCSWLVVDHRKAEGRCDCWIAAYAELGRCLHTMRRLGKQKAVRYEHPRGEWKTIPLGTAYQQLRWWYIDVQTRSVPVYTTTMQRRWDRTLERNVPAKVRRETGRRLERVRHPDAREEKAHAGLRFLGELYRGTPQLPKDIAQLERAA